MASFMPAGSIQPDIEWQWLGDARTWYSYDPAANALIESAYVGGSQNAIVNSPVGGIAGMGASYCIYFMSMEQVNTGSLYVRDIRRHVGANSPCSERWSWMKGPNWEPIPLWVCHQLVASRDRRREQFTVARIHKKVYNFNLSAMAVADQGSGHHYQLRAEAIIPLQSASGVVAAPPGGVPARTRPSRGARNTSSGRDAEFDGVLRAAADCTATIASDESCAVCLDGFSAEEPAVLLSRCMGHYMHAACILQMFNALGPKCPTCSTMYGPMHGDQPDGAMNFRLYPRGAVPLSGHESEGTIVIHYRFPGGTQEHRHPNPGYHYHGTTRTAYLPDSAEGREVLGLLRKSFDHKMTFTIGTSLTTGRSDCVIWNGVHHKTNVAGGCAAFGYPDSGYFARVKDELAAKGIS